MKSAVGNKVDERCETEPKTACYRKQAQRPPIQKNDLKEAQYSQVKVIFLYRFSTTSNPLNMTSTYLFHCFNDDIDQSSYWEIYKVNNLLVVF